MLSRENVSRMSQSFTPRWNSPQDAMSSKEKWSQHGHSNGSANRETTANHPSRPASSWRQSHYRSIDHEISSPPSSDRALVRSMTLIPFRRAFVADFLWQEDVWLPSLACRCRPVWPVPRESETRNTDSRYGSTSSCISYTIEGFDPATP